MLLDVQFTTGASLVDENLEDDDPANNNASFFPNGGDLNGDGLDDALYCSSIPAHNYPKFWGSVWVLWGRMHSIVPSLQVLEPFNKWKHIWCC